MNSIWKVILTVVITALVVGGGTYWYVNSKAITDKATLQASIDSLNKKVTDLEKSTTTSNKVTDWKTYTNAKYSYSIQYPSTWAYREFPDTGTGAGFRLATTSSNPANEFIDINYQNRATQNANLPLDQYLKKEGADIQNFGDIVTFTKVITSSGLVGYEVTWKVTSVDGKTASTSNPFTYFPTGDGKTVGMIVLSSNVAVDSTPYLSDYSKMITTFTNSSVSAYKTYSTTTYSYEYPIAAQVPSASDPTFVYGGLTYTVETPSPAGKSNIGDWIKDGNVSGTTTDLTKYTKITVGGEIAYTYTGELRTYVMHNGVVYVIVARKSVAPSTKTGDTTYAHLLSTFTFAK